MGIFHDPVKDGFAQVGHVAIAIGQPHPDQRHMGVLYRESDVENVLWLHLAWHCDLRNEQPHPRYFWISPRIPAPRARQVAALCRLIWKKHSANGLPYAFSPPNDCFDVVTGAFLFGSTRLGLTCATFVLAVFHSAGLPFVDYASWPPRRPGDADWQEKIISTLEEKGAKDHAAAIRNEQGGVRYRPEEVAGAATANALPASFDFAAEASQRVLALLNNVRPSGN